MFLQKNIRWLQHFGFLLFHPNKTRNRHLETTLHMISVLSPAKTLDFESPRLTSKFSEPVFLDDSLELIGNLKKKSKSQVAKLMNLSEKLSELNVRRYKEFQLPFTSENARQSLLTFKGDVYQGFKLSEWKAADFNFAQKHLRILSGLYGILRPLDLIQAYRLEMGTKLKNERGKDLYEFWGDKITDAINVAVKESRSRVLINLASKEYFDSVNQDNLTVPIVTPVFKDWKNGKYKIISFFAKKARGMMANFIVQQRIKTAKEIEKFNVAGYYFDPDSSDDQTLTFLREEQ